MVRRATWIVVALSSLSLSALHLHALRAAGSPRPVLRGLSFKLTFGAPNATDGGDDLPCREAIAVGEPITGGPMVSITPSVSGWSVDNTWQYGPLNTGTVVTYEQKKPSNRYVYFGIVEAAIKSKTGTHGGLKIDVPKNGSKD